MHLRCRRACWFAGLAVALAAATSAGPAHAQVVLPPGLGMPGGQTVPSPGFDLTLAALAAGEYTQGLEIGMREHRGGIRAGANRWIDSIATAAVVGECHYELGSLREAVAAYDEALLLSATYGDWLLAVQFPPQGPRPAAKPRVATWGRSQRNATPCELPGTMSILLGGADPQEVLQKGGVLTAPANYPIRPQEIVRSLVIAAYRRGVILGDLAREGAAIDAAAKTLARRPAPPNHYSQSWIDVALGTVLWSQGKNDQAQPLLTRGLLVANQFDHPLSSWALIVLGRIALAGDQFAAAARYFEEATFTAADYGDARALEEAFRLAATAHLAAGTRGVPPVVRNAADWARSSLPLLRGLLLGCEAEALAVAGDEQAAAAALGEIDGRLLRGDPGRGIIGCQQAYAAALTAYAAGEPAIGDRELDRALGIARRRSPRLFQATRVLEMAMTGVGGVSDRQADLLFAKLLRDPTPAEVAVDPLDSIAILGTPRAEAFEAWIGAAARRGGDAPLDAAEAAIRSRWLVAQPFGGGRVAAAALLAADPDRLPRADATRRAGILARHPDLAAALDAVARLRPQLTADLLVAGVQPDARPGPPGVRGPAGGEPAAWRDYQKLADRCRVMIAGIASGRGAPPIDMPPCTPAAEIRRRLAPKQLVLSFHWASGGLFGALESHDRFAVWQVRQPAAVAKEITALAKAMCVFDPLAPVATERLEAGDWQLHAERLERLLFENSKVALAEGVEELIVVPDGMLWYLPFELLPVGSERPAAAGPAEQSRDPRRLRDVCRIRYAPTRSLAVLRFEPAESGGPVGIQAGRLFRGDRPAVAQESAARLAQSLDRCVVLPAASPTLAASLCETLVVLDELAGDGPVGQRTLFSTPAGKQSASFAEWLAPPGKRPRCVLLPGFQSAMAAGLAKPPARPGEELFLAATDLMAAGSRTVLLTRWRMGGETCIDLVEQYLGDRAAGGNGDAPSPAESWQRAIDAVLPEQPDVGREPRLKQSAQTVLPDGRHPFLWAGYMLFDCGGGRYEEPPAGAAAGKPVAAPPAAAKPPAAPPRQPPANPGRGPLNPAQAPLNPARPPANPAEPGPPP